MAPTSAKPAEAQSKDTGKDKLTVTETDELKDVEPNDDDQGSNDEPKEPSSVRWAFKGDEEYDNNVEVDEDGNDRFDDDDKPVTRGELRAFVREFQTLFDYNRHR